VSNVATEAGLYLDIDWSLEPRSKRERDIRQVLLRRQLAKLDESPMGALFGLYWLLRPNTREYASDFQAAFDLVQKACEERRLASKRQDIEEAIRELDGAYKQRAALLRLVTITRLERLLFSARLRCRKAH
jgi:hypothetical protein